MSSYLPRTTRARALVAIVLLLTVAAIYEAAIALQIVSMGKRPGDGAAGEGYVLLIALLAMLVGSFVSLSFVSSRSLKSKKIASLVAPTAAAFVVARFYTFDDYFLPDLRRMSEDGNVAGSWIVALVVFALVTAVVTKVLPRIGIVMTSVVLLASAVLTVGVGIGH
jgi:hypothetical protein